MLKSSHETFSNSASHSSVFQYHEGLGLSGKRDGEVFNMDLPQFDHANPKISIETEQINETLRLIARFIAHSDAIPTSLYSLHRFMRLEGRQWHRLDF